MVEEDSSIIETTQVGLLDHDGRQQRGLGLGLGFFFFFLLSLML